MTKINKTCPNCSKSAIYDFDERIINKKLFWSASLNCQHCGCAIESDDVGRLPEDLRSHVLAEEGIWQLEIVSADSLSLNQIDRVHDRQIDVGTAFRR